MPKAFGPSSCRSRRARGTFGGTFAGPALGMALGVAGCAPSTAPPAGPEATVVALARALSEGKLDAAYALMSPDFRQRVSLAQWQHELGENPQEVIELGNQLSHARGQTHEQARVRYGDDAELQLSKVDGRWLVDSDVAGFYDQSTPRAALASFVRAMEAKRYDIVMRLIPNADKEGMTTDRMEAAWTGDAREEVERMLAGLRDHREDPIEVVGDHATMPYGERRAVQFLREDGVWKIEDPQ